MDGGRGAGGGRGKSKKGKAAKKKAAAAAQAAASAASRKKPASAHHGGKKVGTNHANVQVVAVSKASATHAAHNGAGEAKVSTEQTTTKSKRKRLKKWAAGATNALLKKHAAAETAQQTNKSPTAAGNASAASPKTAVLAPSAAAVASAKPHVVSLTGGKKRKRHAALNATGSPAENDAAVAATTLAAATDGKKSPSVVKAKKTVVVVGHSVVPTSGATKTVAPVASPKRKTAQVGKFVQKPQIQTAASAASPKNETATTPRKILEKIKAKPAATAIGTAIPTTTVAAPKGVSEVSGKQRQQEEEPKKSTAVVSLSELASASQKTTKLGAVTLDPEAVQVKQVAKKLSPVQQTPLASDPLKTKTCAPSAKSEGVTTLKNLTKKRKTTAGTTVVPARSANNGKSVSPSLNPSKTPAEAADAGTSAIDKKNSNPVPEATIANTAAAAKPLASSFTETSLNVRPKTPATVSTKLLPSPVANARVSSPESGHKRQRSTEPVTVNSPSDLLQPPAKRNVVSSKIAATSSRASSPSNFPTDRAIPVDGRLQPVETTTKVNDKQLPAKSAAMVVAPSTSAPPTQPTAQSSVPENQLTHAVQLVGKTAIKSTAETKTRSEQTQDSTSEVAQSTTKAELSQSLVKVQEVNHPSTGISAESTGKLKKVGIIMDSHVYVQKMMKGESATSTLSNRRNTRHTQSTDLAVALPTRPQNAWGASFGMVPPALDSSLPSRTLTTTPLSSWFLSKGCANFVKQVHFSDDDDDGSSDGDGASNGLSSNGEKATPKRRASVVKKNAFLESLATHSNWRSWYGNVDIHNLLDPPLAHVPEKLRSHEVTPLALPGTELVSNVPGKKADELEMLEADIRREKNRGSAFSEQLLMMLQGKTVSGKLLEEEYRPLLKH